MTRPFISVALAALLLATLAAQPEDAASVRTRARAALAPIDGQLALPGLLAPVEVVRDRWGVPHIYASTLEDLFFAQGFVAAQDRLWQLDLWRRTAEGVLAEILGPEALDRDTFARLLRYRGDMDAEWRSYSPDTRRIVEAFVGGVNAQIRFVDEHPETLPLEFQLTGVRPRPWSPEVVISRMAGYVMTRNLRTEVQRARLAQTIGVERLAAFMPPDPTVPIIVPDGLDLGDITPDVLRLAGTVDDPIRFDTALAKAARSIGWQHPRTADLGYGLVADIRAAADALVGLQDEYSTIGSNNWVVSGAMTSTGRPMLANDPHRAITLPSLRYTVHLTGPGWNVIGAGEPSLPGVAAGHNERVAFGFTIVGTDQQDLYVEHLNPGNPDEYRYKGAWEPMRVERESVRVKGRQEPVEVTLRFTRHGPVIHTDLARHRAYALRWVGMEPGTAGYLASLSLNIARNWEEFVSALDRWKVPSENLVYADVEGNIGWVAAGMTPIRSNWNGLLPVPGHEGKYEWSGFLDVSQLPQSSNPASGFIATANHNILPQGFERMIGYEWGAPYRYRRLVEVLSSRKGFSRADFEALQHDEVSLPARALIEALRVASAATPPPGRDEAFAVKMLTSWDGRLSKTSAPAALYALWLPHVQQALVETVTRPEERSRLPERLALERVVALLEAPTPRQLSLLVSPTLASAWADATSRMGPDPATWAWGRLHQAAFEHPLATTPARAAVMNLDPVPRGGDATTVNNTSASLRQTSGASYREILDVGAWDESTTINVPGLSGQPASRHYGDLLPLWAEGRYHPMPFSREAVDKHAAARLRLVPASATTLRPPAAVAAAPATEGAAPDLPPFAGRVVNFDRRAGRVAACALDPAAADRHVGARLIRPTRVWVIETDVIRQLGETTGSCDPAWSPDASRLAVVQPNGLWTYSPSLDDPRQLAEAHLPGTPRHESDYTAFTRPRWSPDGRFIAYLATNGATTWVEAVEAASGRRAYRSDSNVEEFAWDPQRSALLIAGRTVELR